MYIIIKNRFPERPKHVDGFISNDTFTFFFMYYKYHTIIYYSVNCMGVNSIQVKANSATKT